MAEFQEVSKAYVRMCESYPTCEGCPIEAHGNDLDTCRCSVLKWPEKYESKIMLWAKEHPEPICPTWEEWLVEQGILQSYYVGGTGKYVYTVSDFGCSPIQNDIAEKLGIQPKEN